MAWARPLSRGAADQRVWYSRSDTKAPSVFSCVPMPPSRINGLVLTPAPALHRVARGGRSGHTRHELALRNLQGTRCPAQLMMDVALCGHMWAA